VLATVGTVTILESVIHRFPWMFDPIGFVFLVWLLLFDDGFIGRLNRRRKPGQSSWQVAFEMLRHWLVEERERKAQREAWRENPQRRRSWDIRDG
jgi:hypothetical protein